MQSGSTNISSLFSIFPDAEDAMRVVVNEIPLDEPISKESGAPLAVPRSGRLSDKFCSSDTDINTRTMIRKHAAIQMLHRLKPDKFLCIILQYTVLVISKLQLRYIYCTYKF